jgi:hypothetical protein
VTTSFRTDIHPVLVALFDTLPSREAAVFTLGDRERWIAAMDAALQFLYPPEWSQEARQRARKGKEAAAAYFPTIEAPEHGKVTIGVPPDGFEPVLIVPASAHPPPAQPLYAEPSAHVRASGSDDYVVKLGTIPLLEEAPSRTTVEIIVDAVDDESGGEAAAGSSADPAPATSPPPSSPTPAPTGGSTAPSTSALSKPGSDTPAPARSRQPKGEPVRIIPPPQEGRKRHFDAAQKGAILRRVVREGMPAVQGDTKIHESTLNRWIREMPIAVQTFTEEWEAEQQEKALAEGGPTVAELEAEKERPVLPRPTQAEAIVQRAKELAAKPVVQWPSTPIERRPVDPERVRRSQAENA